MHTPHSANDLKIAYLGGGSREWARKLMMDLALCPDLNGRMALYDINMEAALSNEKLGNWLQDQPGVVSRWKYEAVPTLEGALRGADFVVVSIQPGTLEIMGEEIAIAARHGMHFPVGDTVGAPGLVRGLRAANIYIDFAHQIAEHCPDAWVINYTNPMTVCTRTLTKTEPGLKVFGCCHEVFGTQHLLGELVERYLGVEQPSRKEIRVNVLGINHFTWLDKAYYQDQDLFELVRRYMAEPDTMRPYTLEEVEANPNYFQDNAQVKLGLFERFHILPAAGDRHLVEFLPGFTRSPEELARWGVVRTPIAYRLGRWKLAPQRTRDLMEGRTPFALPASGEEGVQQMRALLGLDDFVTNVNIENLGQISNLPLHAVVETNARFSRDEVRPVNAGAIPDGLLPTILTHVQNQEAIVSAAAARDKDLAFQAVYNDPACNLPVDEAWTMFNELLCASRDYLPGWGI
jgi:galacturan 1,4-alpha-galacturonidase